MRLYYKNGTWRKNNLLADEMDEDKMEHDIVIKSCE